MVTTGLGIQQPGFTLQGAAGAPFRVTLRGTKYKTLAALGQAIAAAGNDGTGPVAKQFAQLLRREAVRGYAQTGLRSLSGQMKGSIVPIHRQFGAKGFLVGVGSLVFYFEYHEHGTYQQRQLSPQFKRQYRGTRRNVNPEHRGVKAQFLLTNTLRQNTPQYTALLKKRYGQVT